MYKLDTEKTMVSLDVMTTRALGFTGPVKRGFEGPSLRHLSLLVLNLVVRARRGKGLATSKRLYERRCANVPDSLHVLLVTRVCNMKF